MGAEATQGRTVAAGTYHGCEHGVGEAWRQQPSVAGAATATAVPPRGGGGQVRLTSLGVSSDNCRQ